eukprot:5591162-Amphidinium_carterae.1
MCAPQELLTARAVLACHRASGPDHTLSLVLPGLHFETPPVQDSHFPATEASKRVFALACVAGMF